MASGERGKAIEEAVAGVRQGQQALQTQFDLGRQLIGGQQDQLRTDFQQQQDLTGAGLDPFVQQGQIGLQRFQEGGTVAGLDQQINQILGSDAFGGLRDERFQDINRQLASSGLSRSGLGLEQIANISPELAFQIRNQLSGENQSLAQFGLSAAGTRGGLGNQLTLGQGQLSTGLTGLEAQLSEQFGINTAAGFGNIGQIQSQGRLDALQAKQSQNALRNSFFGQIAGVGANILAPGSGGFVSAGVTSGLNAF